MHRDVGRKIAHWVIGGVLVTMLALAVGTLVNRGEPNPNLSAPEQGVQIGNQWRDDRSQREVADLNDLHDAVNQAAEAVSARDWARAERHAHDLKERWLSFRTPMQAQAGREIWHVRDIQEFQDAADGLIRATAERRPEAAAERIDTMRQIVGRYRDEGPQPLQTTIRPLVHSVK